MGFNLWPSPVLSLWQFFIHLTYVLDAELLQHSLLVILLTITHTSEPKNIALAFVVLLDCLSFQLALEVWLVRSKLLLPFTVILSVVQTNALVAAWLQKMLKKDCVVA